MSNTTHSSKQAPADLQRQFAAACGLPVAKPRIHVRATEREITAQQPGSQFAGRTAQDLLAERRDNVIERSRETDKMARALLQYHVDSIDAELARRRAATPQRDDARFAARAWEVRS